MNTKSMEALEKIDLSKINSRFLLWSLNLVLLKDWQNAIKSFDILLKKYLKTRNLKICRIHFSG